MPDFIGRIIGFPRARESLGCRLARSLVIYICLVEKNNKKISTLALEKEKRGKSKGGRGIRANKSAERV
jgi:hypothetical protein